MPDVAKEFSVLVEVVQINQIDTCYDRGMSSYIFDIPKCSALSQPNQLTLLPTELSYLLVLGDGSTIHMGMCTFNTLTCGSVEFVS